VHRPCSGPFLLHAGAAPLGQEAARPLPLSFWHAEHTPVFVPPSGFTQTGVAAPVQSDDVVHIVSAAVDCPTCSDSGLPQPANTTKQSPAPNALRRTIRCSPAFRGDYKPRIHDMGSAEQSQRGCRPSRPDVSHPRLSLAEPGSCTHQAIRAPWPIDSRVPRAPAGAVLRVQRVYGACSTIASSDSVPPFWSVR
jgi:hypothetical protein